MRDNGYQIAVTFRFNCIQDLQHAKTVGCESIYIYDEKFGAARKIVHVA